MDVEEDDEYIYPYWDKVFESNKFKRESIPFESLRFLTSIPISAETAKYLRIFEQKPQPIYQAICGRFYEALFQQQNNFAGFASVANRKQLNTLEGAPFDGYLERGTMTRTNTTWSSPFKWLTLLSDNKHMIPWEMKKRTKKGFCNFSSKNIAAITQLGGGMLIGATVDSTVDQVLYRYKTIDVAGFSSIKPLHNYNLRYRRNIDDIRNSPVPIIVGGRGTEAEELRGLSISDL